MQNPQPCDYKILTWNCRQLTNKTNEFVKHSSSYNIIITETWLKPSKNFFIPGFHAIRKDREHSKGGGILIAVQKQTSLNILANTALEDQHIETLVIQIPIKNDTLTIAAVYRTQNSPLDPNIWKKFLTELNNTANFILTGDFNAHHKFWNCSRTDAPGERAAPRNRRNRLHDLKHKHSLLSWI